MAWLCDCPYVTSNPELRLLATPLFQGRPYYRAYLIVPDKDLSSRSVADLRGKVFAYTDPHSNVGYLIPRLDIMRMGDDPDRYFRRTFFTWSHRKAIVAVGSNLAQGASVSSYIWETLRRFEPGVTEATRVVSRSEEFGFPPFVAQHAMPEKTFQAVQHVLLDMANDPRGRALLRKTNLDGFILPSAAYYEKMRDLLKTMQKSLNAP